GTLADRGRLRRLEVRVAERRQVAVLARKVGERRNRCDQPLPHEQQRLPVLQQLRVVGDVCAGRAQVDVGPGRRCHLAEVMDVRHHVVAQLLFQLRRTGEVQRIEVRAHGGDRLVADVDAQLLLGFRKRQPQPAPHAELELVRKDPRHLLRRVPLHQRIAARCASRTRDAPSDRSSISATYWLGGLRSARTAGGTVTRWRWLSARTRAAVSDGRAVGVIVTCCARSPRRVTSCSGWPALESRRRASQSSGVATLRPFTRMIRSPGRSPARSAGEPGATVAIRTSRDRPNRSVSPVSSVTPTHARRTSPCSSRSAATRRARSIGIAKPRPTLPPLPEMIELFTPITSPSALSRGPPELPGLIDASVWIMSR